MRTKRKNTIEAQEARIAMWMLIPSVAIVLSIVLFPVVLNFWVSFKPVKLGDLRPPSPIVREREVRTADLAQISERLGVEEAQLLGIRYQVRNSNPDKPITRTQIVDSYPARLEVLQGPPAVQTDNNRIFLELEDMEGGYSEEFVVIYRIGAGADADSNTQAAGAGKAELLEELLNSTPQTSAVAENILTNFEFTLENYELAVGGRSIGQILLTTIVYALFGSGGALLLGLIAALLVNEKFTGSGIVRGIFLFPYVAPIVAVAFVWRFLFDPQSGTVNELLQVFNIIQEPVSFLSSEPQALISAIFFDAWRYFPFCYLFILARLKAIPGVLYESATIEGAGHFTTFFRITLPQIREILLSVFVLRFIWTFNRFDDIFLLTGGAAGTQTLPIQVYDYALGAGNIGAGSAASVLLFILLSIFLVILLSTSKEVDS